MIRFVRLFACLVAVFALLSTAHAGAKRPPKVAILHAVPAGFPTWPIDVQNNIAGSNLFTAVDRIDVRVSTPSLATLLQYDAVLVFNDVFFSNAAALGNVLADYVDAGGGVVSCTFANASAPLAGRWAPGYRVINPTGQTQPNASLGAIANQNHPIMIGVTALAATQAFQSDGAVLPGNTLVASWSTGGPLVATSNTLPGRADLNFFPPSSAVRADLWNSSGDGAKLMVNALLYVMRPRVLIIQSGTAADGADIVSKVKGTNLFSAVDLFDGAAGTPTLAQLQTYDAALVANRFAWNNRTALGNVLADFVDAGGGVVQTVFTTSGVVDSNLGGRWTGTYDIIPFGPSLTGAATLGAISYPNHPIMAGVVTLDGGAFAPRPSNTGLNPGGLIVAKWSDGKTLVSVSTRFPNRVDLGFWAVSSASFAGSWNPATDGAKLLGNALIYTIKPYIACVIADPLATDAVAKLTASRRFSGVGSIDANSSTPALSTLSPFNAVATWSNSFYNNPTSLGNTLADYVDAGGGVVSAVFGVTSAGFPQGRWITDGYEITPSPLPGFLNSVQQFLGTVVEPNHPIASFVKRFDGGGFSFRQNSTPLPRGRTIMRWTDGKMLTSVHNFRKRADLGYWPVSNNSSNGWNQRTDGTWMTANALEFVVRVKPCPGDFNGDGVVEDSDFVLFAGYYDALVDPRGDLNGDGLTEDGDFVIFAGSYDALVCP